LRTDPKLGRQLATIPYIPYFREYLALGEEICVALSFQGYYTLKYRSWPKDLDEDSVKSTRQKSMRDEHEGQGEERASSHVEDVCIEEDQIAAYDTAS
jgi:hypothetical protein